MLFNYIYVTGVESTTFTNTWLQVCHSKPHTHGAIMICGRIVQVSMKVPASNFIKKETQIQLFSSEFCEMFKNTFSIKTSGGCSCYVERLGQKPFNDFHKKLHHRGFASNTPFHVITGAMLKSVKSLTTCCCFKSFLKFIKSLFLKSLLLKFLSIFQFILYLFGGIFT